MSPFPLALHLPGWFAWGAVVVLVTLVLPARRALPLRVRLVLAGQGLPLAAVAAAGVSRLHGGAGVWVEAASLVLGVGLAVICAEVIRGHVRRSLLALGVVAALGATALASLMTIHRGGGLPELDSLRAAPLITTLDAAEVVVGRWVLRRSPLGIEATFGRGYSTVDGEPLLSMREVSCPRLGLVGPVQLRRLGGRLVVVDARLLEAPFDPRGSACSIVETEARTVEVRLVSRREHPPECRRHHDTFMHCGATIGAVGAISFVRAARLRRRTRRAAVPRGVSESGSADHNDEYGLVVTLLGVVSALLLGLLPSAVGIFLTEHTVVVF